MGYKEKYEAALGQARKMLTSEGSILIQKEALAKIFPELGSKDEIMLERIIRILCKDKDTDGRPILTDEIEWLQSKKDVFAHPEKQKESNIDKLHKISTPAEENWFEIQKQWEQEDRVSNDKNIREDIIRFFEVEKEDRNSPFFDIAIAYLERQKDASKAIEAVERIDKYIDEHLANAHDMKNSNPRKKYYRGWDDALCEMSRILQDVYSEKQKEQKQEIISISEMVSKYRNTDEYDDDGNYKGKPVNCMIRAYEQGIRDTLLKVKEQKPNIELIQRSWYMEGYHDREFCREPKWIIKTGKGGPKYEKNEKYGQPLEQKPAEWSEEEVAIIDGIIEDVRNTKMRAQEDVDYPASKEELDAYDEELDFLNRLKSLRPVKKELGEEEVDAMVKAFSDNLPLCGEFQTYHDALVHAYRQGIEVTLKSPCSQPHWKPSEEQMAALKNSAYGTYQNGDGPALRDLYEQLKKL